MFYVFNEVFEEIPQTLNANHLLSYSLINKQLLQQLCSFLTHFDDVIEKLSDEQRPTIHRVVPLRQYLLKCCTVHDDDDDDEVDLIPVKKFIGIYSYKYFHILHIQQFVSNLGTFQQRFYFCLENQIMTKWIPQDEHFLAAILHPQLKHFDKNPSDKSRAMQLLQDEIEKRTKANQLCSSSSDSSSCTSTMISLPTSSSEEKPSKTRKKNLLSLCFDDPRSPTSAIDEFTAWMCSTLTLDDEENDNILEFWSHHAKSFPVISTIARDIFAIPASNTMVERLFSISKNTITDKRTKLGMEKIDKLLFLRKNLNVLKNLGNQNLKGSEQGQVKRKNDQSASESPDQNVKKSKVDQNDIILIQEEENMFL
jgi:hypothetical protein